MVAFYNRHPVVPSIAVLLAISSTGVPYKDYIQYPCGWALTAVGALMDSICPLHSWLRGSAIPTTSVLVGGSSFTPLQDTSYCEGRLSVG